MGSDRGFHLLERKGVVVLVAVVEARASNSLDETGGGFLIRLTRQAVRFLGIVLCTVEFACSLGQTD